MSGVLRCSTRITLVCYEWSVEVEHKDNTGVLWVEYCGGIHG